jgi:diaminopimelate epimerase
VKISFLKISATGNDFIAIDNRQHAISIDDAALWKKLCARRTGIGADGAILLENSDKADYFFRYVNSDGSVANMCGNGSRALAWFAFHELKLKKEPSFTFETLNDVYRAEVNASIVTVTMTELKSFGSVDTKSLGYSSAIFLDTGVPHCVIPVENLKNYSVVNEGRLVRRNPIFPHGTNVDFIEKSGVDEISMRTYERGVEDETLACGTGAVASAVAARKFWKMGDTIKVHVRGGPLEVIFSGNERFLRGKVDPVYRGVIEI